MLPFPAAGGSNITNLFIFFCLFCSVLDVLDRHLVNLYPHPNVILLLQLSTSAGLARICIGPAAKGVAVSHASTRAALPLAASFFLALSGALHAFNQGADVDQLVVFSTCTPVAVAIAEWVFISSSRPDWLVGALVLLFSAWAGSLLFASLTTVGLACLFSYFACTSFYILHSSFHYRAVQLSSMERVYVQSLLSCLPCFAITMIFDWSKLVELTHLTPWSGSLLALSCIVSFFASYYSWEVRSTPSAKSAAGFAAVYCCSKVSSLIISLMLWDRHGSSWANWLLAAAIVAAVVSQQTKRQPKLKQHSSSSSKGPEVMQDPAAYAGGIFAVAATVAGLLWLGAAVGAAVTRDQTALLQNSRHQLEQEIHVLGQEFATLRHKAADWESSLVNRYTAVAGAGAAGSSNSGTNSSSSSGAEAVDSNPSNSQAGSSRDSSTSSSVTTTARQQASDPEYMQRLKEAASKPINVVVMTGLFWQLDTGMTRNCSVDGIPLDCRFTQTQDHVDTADALYYHVPSFNGVPRAKAFPNQLRLAMSLESAVYYSNLDNLRFMCGFDAEMTYRHCAQVVNWYSLEGFKNLFAKEPLPFEQKQHALVYINSNCGAASGRSTILRELMKLNGSVPVHSLGNCDRNMPWPAGNPKKIEVQRGYKFCVTMENSVSPDYVTEKMWDGLTAGCVPVYLGAPSARDMIPDRGSIIVYDPSGKGNASTPEELDQLMHDIGTDKERYEAMLQWKYRKPEDQPNPLFRYLWSVQHTSGECFLCQFLARHRANPQPRYTTCLFNSTWMEANGRQVVPATGPDGKCPPV